MPIRLPGHAARLLAPGETVRFVTRPRAARLGIVLVLGGIFVVLAIFSAIVEPGFIRLGILPALPLIGAHFGHLAIRPVIFVTNRRVISAARGQKPLIVELRRVKAVNISQKKLERLFSYGDVQLLEPHPFDGREGFYTGYSLDMVADAQGLAAAVTHACALDPEDDTIAGHGDAAVGCILGTAVGDALGLACEGLSAGRQKRWYPSLDGYHLLFGKGLCSDDTEHTCLIAQSILVSGGDETAFERDFAWRLRWWFAGLPAGIGLATLRSIVKLWLFLPRQFRGVHSAGNGPAMRSAILGVCFADDEPRMTQLVRISTRLTHLDPKAECGAMAIALAARSSLRGESFEQFLGALRRLTAGYGAAAAELLDLVERANESVKAGKTTAEFAASLGCSDGVSGYMYHSVPAVLHAWLSYPRDYAAAVTTIIRCGGDSDTTAAMVGAIVGAGVGREGIPAKWLDDLVEWPRTVSWMDRLARGAAYAASDRRAQQARPLSIAGLCLRNAGFMALVLAHGVRRLFPPY
jgi:ADP-ribosylglycohydrolase